MTITVLNFGYQRAVYSGSYEFTITNEPDADYRKYLARKLCDVLPTSVFPHPADAMPVDISLDDLEGDVVAGISAVTRRGTLTIDMLWVDEPLRGQGIGRRLMQMAEEVAIERGCTQARISVTGGVEFYVGMGYSISGTVQQVTPTADAFREGRTVAVYWLCKELV
jgi:GNAT superfamily N-acetyltransferase